MTKSPLTCVFHALLILNISAYTFAANAGEAVSSKSAIEIPASENLESDYSRKKPKHQFDLTKLDGNWKLVNTVAGQTQGDDYCPSVGSGALSLKYLLFKCDSGSIFISTYYSALIGELFMNVDQGVNQYTRYDYEFMPLECAVEQLFPGNSSFSECLKEKGQVPKGKHNDAHTYRVTTYSTADSRVIHENSETTRTANATLIKGERRILTLVDDNHMTYKVERKLKQDQRSRGVLECQYERIN